MSTFGITVDLPDLNSYLDEKNEQVLAAARPAAQAGIQVLYDAIRVNVSALGKKTGNLAASIYQAYSENNSGDGRATYHTSWNAKKAPHGHLVENGHLQRYKVYVGSDGKWYTAVRPSMRDKPKPRRTASQSVKDAYYVPLATPKQVAAQSFVRRAASQFAAAESAARARFFEEVGAA